MRLNNPEYLVLLLGLALFIPQVRRRWFRTRAEPSVLFASSVPLELLPKPLRVRLRTPILSILSMISYSFLVVALARPQGGAGMVEIRESGRDIMLVLDTSGSMQAHDFFLEGQRVDRLSALKSVVREFIAGRKGDRLGIVVFGNEAFTHCPLTYDHRVVKEFVSNLEPAMAGVNTAIGDAIGVALKRMRELPAKSQVIILVTDGKSNSGSLQPLQAARAAQELGVKVYAIGIGEKGPAPFPVRTLFGGVEFVNKTLDYDGETLQQIASLTGGKYFHAKDTSALQKIYGEIDSLEARAEARVEYIQYEELFADFALLGLATWLLGWALSLTVLKVQP